jgi:dipeptidyl aminopeptidase/acylaminoacyl peptidase
MGKTNQSKLFAVMAAAALCLLALVAAQPAEAAFPGKNGKIVFQSNRAGNNIHTINSTGGTVTNLTRSDGNSDPAYSPDGSRIAFVSANPGGNYQIFVINADGTGRRLVTTDPSVKGQPAWSPDGTRIAYVANSFDVDGQTDHEIWSVNADGSGHRQLTDTPQGVNDTQPAWSPLGDKIAFERGGDVYVMNSSGGGEANLTPTSPAGCTRCYQNGDSYPAWSPDGSRIAYVHGWSDPVNNPYAGGGVGNIWVMDDDPTTNDWTNVTNSNSIASSMPAWSPNNGTQIAYVRDDNDIWKMNASGGGHAPVETDPARDIHPDWQPVPVCTARVNLDNDPLVGTTSDDVLCGNSRNNTINGAGGNDIIIAGDGNDRLTGALGNDTINGGPGKDTALYSGSTRVVANLTTEFARDVGMDVLLGIENLRGSNAKDTLTGSASTANVLNGLGGNDVLNVKDGRSGDTANGGTGTDTCRRDTGDAQTSCP